MRQNLLPVLAKGICHNITREEVHGLVDDILDGYKEH